MSDLRYSRQSFLGEDSSSIFQNSTVGVIGLGGGGSHIVQQLAHLGFKRYILYDEDTIDVSNLNRLIGGTCFDVENEISKIDIAKRSILKLQPESILMPYKCKWQLNPEPLRLCDIIFGCVDGFSERSQLEIACRRYLIPYIDIGLDIHQLAEQPPRMAGQVILSIPGGPCMRCLRFLNDDNLSQEAQKYGDAGIHPQVVWANGILASSAVGLAIDLLTNWTKKKNVWIYLAYDGNCGTVTPHVLAEHVPSDCSHFDLSEVGDVIL